MIPRVLGDPIPMLVFQGLQRRTSGQERAQNSTLIKFASP